MQLIKKTDSHIIYQRRDKRHAVKTRKGRPLNGDAKAKVLSELGLITLPKKKQAPTEEASASA